MSGDRIQALFDRIAPAYDALNDWLSLGQHRVWKRMAMKWSGARAGNTCADLCCGSGDLTLLLAEVAGKTGQVWGVDFSQRLLDIARQRSQRSVGTAQIQWMQADVLQLPFEDNTFDAATMGYGLRNVTDIPQALQEAHRVLKPGGAIAILDFHRPESTWMQAFQSTYLEYLVVPIAEYLGLREEYTYIAPSLDRFPIGQVQVQLARAAGFSHAIHYPIAGGMMGVLVARK